MWSPFLNDILMLPKTCNLPSKSAFKKIHKIDAQPRRYRLTTPFTDPPACKSRWVEHRETHRYSPQAQHPWPPTPRFGHAAVVRHAPKMLGFAVLYPTYLAGGVAKEDSASSAGATLRLHLNPPQTEGGLLAQVGLFAEAQQRQELRQFALVADAPQHPADEHAALLAVAVAP